MDLSNFSREDFESGKLNDMLKEVGIDDVDEFVNEFRSEAKAKASAPQHSSGGDSEDEDTSIRTVSSQQASLFSMGTSLFNQFSSGRSGGNNNADLMQGAMKAYGMFSGGQDRSGGSGGFLNNISSSYQNAQKMYALYKQFDKNGDGKITVEDIQIYLQETGLGFVSPYLAKALFEAVDKNHNGSLDFTDLMALVTLLNKMSGQFGGMQQ